MWLAGLNAKAIDKIDNALLLFKDICKRKIIEMQRGSSKHTSEEILQIDFTLVRERELPPPGATSRSCVYLIIRPDGKFYIGQVMVLSFLVELILSFISSFLIIIDDSL